MSLPFLMVLVAGIFSVGFAGLSRSEVASEARLRAFKNRTGSPGARPFVPTGVSTNMASARVSKPVSVYPAFQNSGLINQFRAESELFVADGSWDYRQSPFDGGGPHHEVLTKIVAGGGDAVKDLPSALPLADLLDFLD